MSGGFSANFVPSSLDPLLQGLTQAGAQILDPSIEINPLNNYFFTTISSILIIGLGWYITDKVVEPRISATPVDGDAEDLPEMHDLADNERKGLRWALIVMVLGIAALIISVIPEGSAWRDAEGLSLTPTIAGSRALTPAELVGEDGLERVVAALRLLHRSGGRFAGRVDLEALLERYFALLVPAQQRRLQTRLDAARLLLPAVADRDADYVPSHNDLVLENLMSTRQRLWLIDWEFSAMASPYWDLATICNAAALDYDQSLRLLRAYCADSRPMEESLLFDYRNLLQLLSDCWMAAFVDA